jgi:hypothetical protein
VQDLGAVEANTNLELVVMEKGTKVMIEEQAVGLEIMMESQVRGKLVKNFYGCPEEPEARQEGFSPVPEDLDFLEPMPLGIAGRFFQSRLQCMPAHDAGPGTVRIAISAP